MFIYLSHINIDETGFSNDVAVLNQTYPHAVYDWSPESGFDMMSKNNNNIIPLRSVGAGTHLGLSIVLDAHVDNYFCSSTQSSGFKVKDPLKKAKLCT